MCVCVCVCIEKYEYSDIFLEPCQNCELKSDIWCQKRVYRQTLILQGIDALRCRQPERDAHETYANTL